MKDKIKVIIVDDERDACDMIRGVLNECDSDDIHIAGIAHNTHEAARLLKIYQPDLLFLDIEMPNENAFQFLERENCSEIGIVFVTAYSEFAVKAFRLNAIDYLLKPVSKSDMHNVLIRLREKIAFKRFKKSESSDYNEIQEQLLYKKPPIKIIFKENGLVTAVYFNDILFIEAAGSYSKFYFNADGKVKTLLTSQNIAEYEDLLPKQFFFRIHKSYLINCTHIRKIKKDNAVYSLLVSEFSLPVSRRRYSSLIIFLKDNDFEKIGY